MLFVYVLKKNQTNKYTKKAGSKVITNLKNKQTKINNEKHNSLLTYLLDFFIAEP